ncbi:hypothetical protein [Streptomyces sp. SID3343]|uniref:hypothetical protein n=1 Tax=Streptomyces sp. SID3343 TaxID=2690260 RepID=UPI00136C4EB7|nr:hypothetical protein [Streptomyces sp. SID3343]MYW02251.1 hypothetical protein [Streptomyces sp. SID3343]
MGYDPLAVGGVADYPVKVGSMLLTLVDPHRGFESAYNRWYERDHFYAGCMVGPHLFAGSRWVATRELKNLRTPAEAPAQGAVAEPVDAGSYVGIYWVERGHHVDHFDTWARPQVKALYEDGRGFAERTHAHTALYDHVGTVYRDEDPVPVEVALDHGYDGIVAVWFDAVGGRDAAVLDGRLAAERTPALLRGSAFEIAASWTPSPGEDEARQRQPMPLGTAPGGPERLVQLLFCRGDVREALAGVRAYTDAVEEDGLAVTRLVAPFFRTVPGTDRHVADLW